MSFSSRKKIILVFILVQLITIPVILFAVKKQQETRSRAEAPNQTLIQADQIEGMKEIEATNQSNFEPETKTTARIQTVTTTNTLTNNIASVKKNTKVKKEVYGFLWYPYVDSDSDKADSYLQYPYMTTLAYAGLVLKKDGTISHTNTPYQVWQSQRLKKILNEAHNNGVKIHPRIALFNSGGENPVGELLNSTNNRKRAVASIIAEIKNSPNPIDGVNIDFEPVPSSSRDEFSVFIKDLRAEMNKVDPKLEIVVDTFASTAVYEGGFDLKKLDPYVNGFFVMSFTLVSNKSSDYASSHNPYSGLVKIADQYLAKIPSSKIILGFPFYTARWKTVDDSFKSAKVPGSGGPFIFITDAQAEGKAYGVNYDTKQQTAWYSYYTCGAYKGWNQVYFDNERAQTQKFQIANIKNLKGVGFWTFNQDKGYLDTWQAIYNAFGDKSQVGAPTEKSGHVTPAFKPNSNCHPPTPTPTPTIRPSSTPTPTSTPKPTLTPTSKPIITQNPTNSPNPTPGTTLKVIVGIDGIGVTSRIPLGGNKNPKNKNRALKIKIYKASDNSLVFSGNQVFSFNSSTNRFDASISLPSSFETGIYNIYALGNPFLTARYPGSVTITKNQTTVLNSDSFNLITGDVNKTEQSKNLLNILDYNVLVFCSVFTSDQSNCAQNPDYKTDSDLNDNGTIDQDDLTLLIKEMGNQSGDILPGD